MTTQWTPQAIKALRLRHGVSQAELAEAIGTTQQRVSAWETGRNVPGTMACKLLSSLCELEEPFMAGDVFVNQVSTTP